MTNQSDALRAIADPNVDIVTAYMDEHKKLWIKMFGKPATKSEAFE